MERWGTYTFGIGVRPHLRLSLSPFVYWCVPNRACKENFAKMVDKFTWRIYTMDNK